MPKRKAYDDKLQKYLRKIEKIKKKCRRSSRPPSRRLSSLSEDDYNNDWETVNPHAGAEHLTPTEFYDGSYRENMTYRDIPEQVDDTPVETPVEVDQITLDRETLEALGKAPAEKQKYGPNINGDLAKLWSPILKNGLGDAKDKQQMLDKYLIPNNCQLLDAPKLNPEIIATVTDPINKRDHKIESEQKQLGQGLTALNRALSLLATNTGDRASIINTLSEAAQILSDLHYSLTTSRKRLITPILDKKFLDLIKDTDRDEYLYGNDLSEKIKALKYAQKTSHSIKKPTENFKQYKPGQFNQGNYRGPPKYQYQYQYHHQKHRSGPKRPSYQNSHYKARPYNYNQVKKSKPETKSARK